MRIRVMSGYALSTISLQKNNAELLPVYAVIGAEKQQIGNLKQQQESWYFFCGSGQRLVRTEAAGLQPLVEPSCRLEEETPCFVQVGETNLVQLMLEEDPDLMQLQKNYTLPQTSSVQVGGSSRCEIRWARLGEERELLSMKRTDAGVQVDRLDPSSPWNLYCNDVCVYSTEAHAGDTLYCGGLRILIGPGTIRLCGAGAGLHCTLPAAGAPEEIALPVKPQHNSSFHIAPAAALLPVQDSIRVEPPPAEPTMPQQGGALMSMLPGIMMALAMLITCMLSINGSGAANLTSMISSMVMVLCMVISCLVPVFNRRRQKREMRRQQMKIEADYRAYLDKLEQTMKKECEAEVFNLKLRNPPLEGDVVSLAVPGGGNRQVASCAMRAGKNGWSGLWERKPSDADYLQIAVGSGDLEPACRLICQPEPQIGEVPVLYRNMEEKVQKMPRLENVPVTLDLRRNRLVGIVGKKREGVLRQALGMLVELATLHNYEDLRLAVIYNEKEMEFWRFASWIPHLWREDDSMRYLANDAGEIKFLSQKLLEVLHQRSSQHSADGEQPTPWYVIVDADQRLGQRAEVIRELYQAKGDVGMTLIELCESEKLLPRNCDAILDVDHMQLSLRRENTVQEQMLKSMLDFRQDAEALFRNLSHIRLQNAEQKQKLETNLSFLDMLRGGNSVMLNIRPRCNEIDPVHSVAVPLGQDGDGFPVMLDIHQKAHGPHGLVAGMTGSGKSELLISYILAMAVNFRPDEVSFILIDFKGGGMADVFRGLPHLAGSITNLDGNELRRSFLAIESELEHRQQIFQQTTRELQLNAVDIYKYQELYRQGRVAQPMPHLIIVSDEFAELRHQQGDFMEQLIRIARIGRSLGVHLILATQKPDGVVDEQIRSNTRYRICLKVQDKQDSQAVLERPDAAALTAAGRFYLKVGMNEIFELGQSGYTGTPYLPKAQYEPPRDDTVSLLDEQGRVILAAAPAVHTQTPDLKQITAVLQKISQAAQDEKLEQHFIWAKPLEMVQRAVTQEAAAAEDVQVQVGCYDDLYNREHKPLYVTLGSSGGAAVYGMSGSGKSEFVNRVLLECVQTYSPGQIRFYLADADSGTLQAFERAGHTAWLAMPGEYAQYEEMLDKLNEQIAERRRLLQPFGGDRARYLDTGKEMPLLLCVVHGSSGFFSGRNSDKLVEKLRDICRNGPKYGVCVLVTAADSRSLHYSLSNQFRQIYVLRLTNESEYENLLGRTHIRPMDGLGRGLIRVARGTEMAVYEFQVDVPFVQADNAYQKLTEAVEQCNARWGADTQVFRLPEKVTPEMFDDFAPDWHAMPVALNAADGTPVCWDFWHNRILQCSMPTSAAQLRGLVALAARQCTDGEVLVLDGAGFGAPLAANCTVVRGSALSGAVRQLYTKFQEQTEHAVEVFQRTGTMPYCTPFLVVLYDTEAVCKDLDSSAKNMLEELLDTANEEDWVTSLFFITCSDYKDPYSGLRTLKRLRPAKGGLALSLPDTRTQQLLDCRELGVNSTGTGIVQDGKLIRCGFAEEKEGME